MIYWLASYPRSGNTFLRILFKEVYGIYTWEGYDAERPSIVLKNQIDNSLNTMHFIKTHDLPSQTEIEHSQFKAIYIVRDGRDAAVSMAYHRSNLVKPGSNYLFNLRSSILVPYNTSFGGWSKHVQQWSAQTDIVIRFEDLIKDPLNELKKLEKIIELPTADYSKIPSFTDLKNNKYFIGSGSDKLNSNQQQQMRNKFFRAGKTNEWKTKIPRSLQKIFIYKHGDKLKELGYTDTNSGKFIIINLIKQYSHWVYGYLKEMIVNKSNEKKNDAK